MSSSTLRMVYWKPMRIKNARRQASAPAWMHKSSGKMAAVPHEAGVDEAGCGSLMGDLVAAAVILPKTYDTAGLDDSKKLSEKKRDAIGTKLRREVATIGIGKISREEIDAHGLGWARRAVFERALDALSEKEIAISIVVDGTGFFDGYNSISDWKLEARADSLYASVAAASIIAKTERDADIVRICDAHPEMAEQYGWRSNKGYPAPAHKKGIQMFGITEFHRRSFAPCKTFS